jgi:primosomal protein N' (replication factor Y)
MPVLRLAIASPLRQIFDYLPPQGSSAADLARLQPGCRILVPFGSRQVCGILVEVADTSSLPRDKLKPASRILDPEPLINPVLVSLCHWAANYYKHPLGEILAAALPTSLRKGKQHQTNRVSSLQLTTIGKGLPADGLARAPRQAELLRILLQQARIEDLSVKKAGIKRTTVREMLNKGLVEEVHSEPCHVPAGINPGPALNAEQLQAVSQVHDAGTCFGVWLLDGVTGSGKTEVYFSLIEQVLKDKLQALVLIPEIGLSPQTLARFEQRFNARIAVLHSGLAEGARMRAWEDARSGIADIVLGTRSAIFCSLRRPGLVVVDEEHDGSYKQQDGFRYSARDIAVKRGQLEDVPVILGSATPSLESLGNAAAGKYRHLRLRRRATDSALPHISTLDVRHLPMQGALSQDLVEQLRTELDAGNQALLFLNRRGYAPALQCHDCGYIAGCRHCDSRLTLHRSAGELRCHHCEWRCPCPPSCPDCRSRQLHPTGVGTEQTEQVLKQHFPDFPLYRVDRDSMARRGAMEEVLQAVHSGQPCLLLGTQMLTKGHHFPDVTLVGLLDADAGLFSPDFRGPERMGQLVIQVAGRAGRERKPGRVILQTHYPDHPLLQILLNQGYEDFARQLLEERRSSAMPPYGQLLLLRSEARDMQTAEELLRQLRRHGEGQSAGASRFLGPMPAPLPRKGGRYRAQLLISCQQRSAAQSIAEQLVSHAEQLPLAKKVRWSIDVDPIDMM